MNGGNSPRGYTIVEVMIFLAISGVMFLLAVAFVSGKQAKAEFQQGMNDINSQVQQVINNVSDGLTAFNGNFKCVASAGEYSFPSGTNTTGSNLGCVSLGKVIQFDVKPDSGGAANPSAYNIYTVIGRQFYTADDIAHLSTTFTEAQPIALAPDSSISLPSEDNLTQYDTLNWGLQVTKMTSNGNPINGVGFFSDFGGLTNGGQQSGSQTVQIIPMTGPHSALGETEADMVGGDWGIDSSNTYNNADLNPDSAPDILICFTGPDNEYGTLTIGGDASTTAQGQRLTTSIQISDNQIGSCST